MSDAEKVRENRVRRMAERQGLKLVKSRRRDPRATDYERYMLVEMKGYRVVAGTDSLERPAWDLDQVERWLTGAEGADA